MNRTEAFREIRALASEAVSVLGRRRLALGAGCSVTSIDAWLRCSGVRVHPKTIDRTLPRLRQWEDWVDGYRAEQGEVCRLTSALEMAWGDIVADLDRQLRRAIAQLSRTEIALGCEVAESILGRWCLGNFPEKYRLDTFRALGHLRHVESWPVRRKACTVGASAS